MKGGTHPDAERLGVRVVGRWEGLQKNLRWRKFHGKWQINGRQNWFTTCACEKRISFYLIVKVYLHYYLARN